MMEVLILCVASAVSVASAKLITDCQDQKQEYDHGFDQFLDEDEIDIKTFVLPQLPKCSICTLPFPFELDRTIFKQCCGNMVCRACDESTFYGELKRRLEEEPHTSINFASIQRCPFCRNHPPKDGVPALEKLAECGNSKAMTHLAHLYHFGGEGVPIDHKRSIDLYHMAARGGNSSACYHLENLYRTGQSFDDIIIQKDRGKAIRLNAKGARLGKLVCLYNLGVMLGEDGQDDYALYFLKAASCGLQKALDAVKKCYMHKIVTKEDYASALRCFQAVHDQINNEERTKFNKRLAAHETLRDFTSMTKERQVEAFN